VILVTCPYCHGLGRTANSQAVGGHLGCLVCDGEKQVTQAVAGRYEAIIAGYVQKAPPQEDPQIALDLGDWNGKCQEK